MRQVVVFVEMIEEVAGVQVGQFGGVDKYGFVLEEFFRVWIGLGLFNWCLGLRGFWQCFEVVLG